MPNIVTHTSCPVCGNNDIEKVLIAIDYFSSEESFPLFDCLHCGFRFTNNVPSEEVVGQYYNSPEYISHSDTRKGLINKIYHFARQIMVKRKVRLVMEHASRTPIKLLDMGCGTGYFLHAAKEEGMIVSGIEKDKKAREFANINFGLEVKDNDFFWNLKSQSFDVITLWHVLEHLEKLNESIDKIKSCLTEDGILVIAVPNHRSFDATFYKKYWAAYDVPRHLWHFSPETIENLLSRHGMTLVKQYSMPLDAFYISLLSERYKGSNLLARYSRAFLIGLVGYTRSLFSSTQSSSLIYIAKTKTD